MTSSQWVNLVSAQLAGMKAESDRLINVFTHNGSRGYVREVLIKRFLRPFLPPNVGIGSGEIINHLGMRSNQVDVVLYNVGKLPPALASGSDVGVFPWECVIAVIEVKSELTAKELRSSVLNAYSVCKLPHAIPFYDAKSDDKYLIEYRQWCFPIPAYVFAFNSNLEPMTRTNNSIGPEGERLQAQLEHIENKRARLGQVLCNALEKTDEKEVKNARKALIAYRSLNDDDSGDLITTSVSRSDLHGICVLNREFYSIGISFGDENMQRYTGPQARTITNFGYHKHSIYSNGDLRETTYFLKQLLTLAHEMPKCFEPYTLDRYLG
ncbi:MAG: DUF6602 domain-containing protein [Rhodanobacter sp.]